MGERTQYAPGTFSWIDLTTTDQAAARAFYAELFGWEAEDMPVGEGIVYSIMRLDGHDVAAISPQPRAQREAGAPPTWNSYVTVASVDDVASRAAELGAAVHASPFDVFDAGRMAVIQDPQGAWFMVWEPRAHIGARLVNAYGALVWNELATTDLDAASDFYAALFGWTIAPSEDSEAYLLIRNEGMGNGGMRAVTPPDLPPHWLVYVGVEDLAAALERVRALGGAVSAGPIDLEMAAQIAVVTDPQGASFALYDGVLEP